MTHGSLFSGIGGFDLASEWMGWENVFHCEWNEFGQKVLKYYWPKAITYEDITKTDFSIHRGKIDILTGGFPCQPYSTAGKRNGKEDERHLWPEMLRAIREIKPVCVVGENVSGLLSWNGGLVFNEVQADLENEGYQVQPVILPACAVNAPHRRDRIWFVAYSACNGHEFRKSGSSGQAQGESKKIKEKRKRVWNDSRRVGESGATTNPGSTQLQERTPERDGQNKKEERTRLDNRSKRSGNVGNAAYSVNEGLQGNERYSKDEGENREWREGAPRAISELYRGSNFEQFPTQSPICTRNDGFSTRLDGITFPKWRNESIKAGGNAIVPQVAYQIFKAIQKTNI